MNTLLKALKTYLQLTPEERAQALTFIKDKDALQQSAQLKGQEKANFYEQYLSRIKGTR